MALSREQVSRLARLIELAYPPEAAARARRVDLALTGDGRVRGDRMRGPIDAAALPAIDVTQVALGENIGGLDADNLEEFLDAVATLVAGKLATSGGTLTGGLTITVTDGTALLVEQAGGNDVVLVDTSAQALRLRHGTDLIVASDAGGSVVATLDGATGNLSTVGTLGVDGDTTLGDGDGDVTLTRGHDRHKSTAPSIAVGAALGTGGSVGVTISGSDQTGEIALTAGTSGLGTGVAATITFATARPNTQYQPIVTPKGTSAGINAVQYRTNNAFAASWTISFGTAPTAGVTYTYHYTLREWTN